MLRPYQLKVIEELQGRSGNTLVVMPTGSGKTRTICAYMAANPGINFLFLVHRQELYNQSVETFSGLQNVTVAKKDTLVRRLDKYPGVPDIIIADEAHLSDATTYSRIFKHWPGARRMGLTATPVRLKGTLANVFDELVVGPSVAELIEAGYLADYEGFFYEQPDMAGVRIVSGDYDIEEAGRRGSAIVGDVVGRWLECSSDRTTAVFAASLKHAQDLVQAFRARGIAAEAVDGQTPAGVRRDIFRRLGDGTTRVLVNVGIVTEGFDLPSLKCVVLCRPTMSLALYLQMVGRALRPFAGQWARIHDHAGCVLKHGLPNTLRQWSLGELAPARPPSLSTCKQCMAIFVGSVCPRGCPVTPGSVREVREERGAEFDISLIKRNARPLEWTEPGQEISGMLWHKTQDYAWIGDYFFKMGVDLKKKLPPPGKEVVVTYVKQLTFDHFKRKKVFSVEIK